MNKIISLVKSEPAVIMGAIQAVIALAVAFGLHLTDVRIGALLAAVAAVFAVIVRSQVTPTAG